MTRKASYSTTEIDIAEIPVWAGLTPMLLFPLPGCQRASHLRTVLGVVPKALAAGLTPLSPTSRQAYRVCVPRKIRNGRVDVKSLDQR